MTYKSIFYGLWIWPINKNILATRFILSFFCDKYVFISKGIIYKLLTIFTHIIAIKNVQDTKLYYYGEKSYAYLSK